MSRYHQEGEPDYERIIAASEALVFSDKPVVPKRAGFEESTLEIGDFKRVLWAGRLPIEQVSSFDQQQRPDSVVLLRINIEDIVEAFQDTSIPASELEKLIADRDRIDFEVLSERYRHLIFPKRVETASQASESEIKPKIFDNYQMRFDYEDPESGSGRIVGVRTPSFADRTDAEKGLLQMIRRLA